MSLFTFPPTTQSLLIINLGCWNFEIVYEILHDLHALHNFEIDRLRGALLALMVWCTRSWLGLGLGILLKYRDVYASWLWIAWVTCSPKLGLLLLEYGDGFSLPIAWLTRHSKLGMVLLDSLDGCSLRIAWLTCPPKLGPMLLEYWDLTSLRIAWLTFPPKLDTLLELRWDSESLYVVSPPMITLWDALLDVFLLWVASSTCPIKGPEDPLVLQKDQRMIDP